jgi:hypothetical protein
VKRTRCVEAGIGTYEVARDTWAAVGPWRLVKKLALRAGDWEPRQKLPIPSLTISGMYIFLDFVRGQFL